MSNEVKRHERGSLVVDATALGDFLIDAAPGILSGIRRAQEGFDDVVREIVENQNTIGKDAGILQSEVDELRLLTERIELIGKCLPAARKLVEMMVETEAIFDNRCQEIVRNIAKTVDVRFATTKDTTLFAKYEKTRKYRSASAKKGAKTRQKKAATAETGDKVS